MTSRYLGVTRELRGGFERRGGPVPKFKTMKNMDPGTKDNGKRPPVTIEVHFASMKNQDLGVPISAVDRVLFGVCSAQKAQW